MESLEFKVLGHACLFIELGEIKLLIDPWLVGSTYWRSWWNYPKVDEKILSSVKPTHIYITHLHWDHFHGPSLKYFEKYNPEIILPKACTERMKLDMRKFFNFNNIYEIEHSKKIYLSKNFSITSYQFNPIIIDSVLVIESKNQCLLNANDTKVFGLSLRQIIKNHKPIDFVFRSHSSASQIPHCIEGYNNYGFVRSKIEYAEEFIRFAEKVNARYAIPFASSHIYLHKLSREYNRFYNSPKEVYDLMLSKRSKVDCQIMPSGSKWSSKDGFQIIPNDYSSINKHIEEYYSLYKEKIDKDFKNEFKKKVNKKAFYNYFKDFLSSLSILPTNLKFGFLILKDENNFSLNDLAIVDMKKRRSIFIEDYNIEINKNIPKNLDFILTITPKIFNDCNLKKMYNCWGPSKLMKIHLKEKKMLKKYHKFCLLIDLFENDGLPFWNIFRIRQMKNRFIRWREIYDMILYFFKIKIRKKSIASLWD